MARLGEADPLRLLAASGEPVPDDLLATAAGALGFAGGPRWVEPYLASGWLISREGPWGEGVDFAAPVWRAALAATLPPESLLMARRALGGRLAAAAPERPSWATYQLLAGSLAGARELVALVRGPHADAPRAALFEALRSEAVEVAALGEGEDLERELLWALLPLGRRLGRLGELGPELERAQQLVADRPERFVAIATVHAELEQNAGRYREAEQLLRRALAASREGSGVDSRRQALVALELGRVLQRRAAAEARLLGVLPVLDAGGRHGSRRSAGLLLGNLASKSTVSTMPSAASRGARARRSARGGATAAVILPGARRVRTAMGDFFQAVPHREADGTRAAIVATGRTAGSSGSAVRSLVSEISPPRGPCGVPSRCVRDSTTGLAGDRPARGDREPPPAAQLADAEREARRATSISRCFRKGRRSATLELLLGGIISPATGRPGAAVQAGASTARGGALRPAAQLAAAIIRGNAGVRRLALEPKTSWRPSPRRASRADYRLYAVWLRARQTGDRPRAVARARVCDAPRADLPRPGRSPILFGLRAREIWKRPPKVWPPGRNAPGRH